MEGIYLIEPRPGGLRQIKSYLSDINARYAEFGSVHDLTATHGVPSLLLLLAHDDHVRFLEDVNSLTNNPYFTSVPKIAILPSRIYAERCAGKVEGVRTLLKMPVDRHRFLQSVAEAMDLAPRRVCRILVTVQPGKGSVRYSAVSRDFSENGMSFDTIADLAIGQEIRVTFVNPKSSRRLQIGSTVMRKIEAGAGNVMYGVRFAALAPEDKKEILDFISE